MIETTKKRILWIDSIKFIACIFVLLAHYYESFLYVDAAKGINQSALSFLKASGGIVNGDLWVCMFCLISGYFAEKKYIDSIHSFISESFLRYIKLTLSFFFVGLIILLMSNLGFLLNPQAESIVGPNKYLSLFYQKPIDAATFLSGVFLFNRELNQPTWMMSMILIGNIIIYFISWIKYKINKKNVNIAMLLAAIVVSFILNKLFVSCCLIGAVLSTINESDKSKMAKVATLTGAYLVLCIFIFDVPEGLLYICCNVFKHDYETLKHTLMVPLIFIIINNTIVFKKILSIRPLEDLSAYSFPIFLLHWPILSSFTLLFYKIMLRKFSYSTTFFSGIMLTIPAVIVMSVLYSKTLGKLTDNILGKMKNLLNKRKHFNFQY